MLRKLRRTSRSSGMPCATVCRILQATRQSPAAWRPLSKPSSRSWVRRRSGGRGGCGWSHTGPAVYDTDGRPITDLHQLGQCIHGKSRGSISSLMPRTALAAAVRVAGRTLAVGPDELPYALWPAAQEETLDHILACPHGLLESVVGGAVLVRSERQSSSMPPCITLPRDNGRHQMPCPTLALKMHVEGMHR